MDNQKSNDLLKRLEHKDTNSALAAEAELSVLWAISRVAHMEPEPELPYSGRRPDAYSDDLFSSGPAVIEIRALSDDSFSGKEAMDRTANIISGFADQLRKGAGEHLYFEFNERIYYTNDSNLRGLSSQFHRERCVDPNFNLDDEIKDILRQWIKAPDWPNPGKIHITHGKADFIISWKKSTVKLFRTFCRMPAIAYDLVDNPIYKSLKKKAAQIKGANKNVLRCVILVDAGCSMLRRLRPLGVNHEVDGGTIIQYALRQLSIDVVIVISPYRQRQFVFSIQSEMVWNISCFDKRNVIPDGEYKTIQEMTAQLPKATFEAYQARDIHKQGGFSNNGRNWCLPTIIKTGGGKMTIKLSAELLHEYLAGRIDEKNFRQKAFKDDKNFFDMELTRGNSIRKVQFEAGGLDRDDDYIVFDLDIDWNKVAKKT